MLPTPSWLRFRKSRGQQQQTSKQCAQQQQQEQQQQQQQQQQHQLQQEQEQQQQEQQPAGRRPLSAEAAAGPPLAAATLSEAPQVERLKLEQQQGRPASFVTEHARQSRLEQSTEGTHAARQQRSGQRQQQQQQQQHRSGRNLPNVRRALASLIQRALSPISVGQRHDPPSECSRRAASSAAAGRSPLRKFKRRQPPPPPPPPPPARTTTATLPEVGPTSSGNAPSEAREVEQEAEEVRSGAAAGLGQFVAQAKEAEATSIPRENTAKEEHQPQWPHSLERPPSECEETAPVATSRGHQPKQQQQDARDASGNSSSSGSGRPDRVSGSGAHRVEEAPLPGVPTRPAAGTRQAASSGHYQRQGQRQSAVSLIASRGIASGGSQPSRPPPPLQQQHQQRQQSQAPSAMEPSVCHLTARTSDNQCALHKATAAAQVCAKAALPSLTAGQAQPAQPLSASSGQSPINAESIAHKSGSLSQAAEPAAAEDSSRSGSAPTEPTGATSTNASIADATPKLIIATSRNTIGSSKARARRKRRQRGEHDVASWPLAKRTLGANNLSFGDCEDISGPWRVGRLFLWANGSNGDSCAGSQVGAAAGTTTTTAAAVSPAFSAHVQPTNYSHRRPFAQPFERPTTGWLYNATAPHKINLPRAPQSLKAKLLAVGGFRRSSYDDRAGDNDINVILQPSDFDDIEKQASLCGFDQAAAVVAMMAANINNNNNTINNYRQQQQQFKASRHKTKPSRSSSSATLLTSSAEQSLRPTLGDQSSSQSHSNLSLAIASTATTSAADLKLAKSLLDQDYNRTVRLFIRKSALNWNFNSFTFDALCCGRSLTELLLHLFDYYNLFKIFNLNIVNVLKCFRLLEFGYHSTNPYHNSIHAADVTQAMHCFMQENKIREHMTHLETLCSILAAVCHDLDHPGVNQSFLVATNNPLASLYNNNSVLENHHWRFALCIFKEAQLFEHFQEDVMNEMKKQLKHLILATDIARQNDYLKRFRDLTSSEEFSMSNTDDRALVLQMALKCADLGNPCRPWLISRVWSNLICDEFYKMGSIERRLGIPLTPICQREKTSIAGIQTDFFRFIVLPLLELWHKFLESPLSNLLMSNFEHNYQRWQRANRIVQQLRRRKSVACLGPVESGYKCSNSGTGCGEHCDGNGHCRGKSGGQGKTSCCNDDDGELQQNDENKCAENTRKERVSNCICLSLCCCGCCADPAGPINYSNPQTLLGPCSRHSFAAIKRASSDYIKSGNGSLELLRNFQLDRIIEKSPLMSRSSLFRNSKSSKSCRSSGVSRCGGDNTLSTGKRQRNQSQSQGCTGSSATAQQQQQCKRPAKQHCIGGDKCGEPPASSLKQQQQQQSIKSTSRNLAMCSSNYRKALSPIEDGDAPSPDPQQQQDSHAFLSCGGGGITKTTAPASTATSTTAATAAPTTSAFPPSPQSSASSSVSQASSACSSPVIQRSMSSRTSIDQLVGGHHSAVHLQQQHHHRRHHHQHHIKPQNQRAAQLQHHPFLAQYYTEPSGGHKLRPLPTNSSSARLSTPSSVSRSKSLYNNKRRESDPGCCTDKYELAAAIVLIQYQNNSFFHQRRSSLPVCVPKRRSSK